jgi:hypothetical protein
MSLPSIWSEKMDTPAEENLFFSVSTGGLWASESASGAPRLDRIALQSPTFAV